MKKLVLLTSALCLFGGYAAKAEVSVNFDTGTPVYAYPEPAYVVAPDWPTYHYDHHRHWHNDYWAARDHERWDREHHEDHDRR